MSFRCNCLIMISESDPGVRFSGGQESFPQQKGGRLFPMTRVKERMPQWVELSCTRSDEHPLSGEHWHETPGGFRLTWSVPKDAVWIAGSSERTEP